MRYRALIFDVDGTLADTERHGHRVAFNDAFRRAGLDWEWDEALYGALLKVAGGKERLGHYVRAFQPRWQPPEGRAAAMAALHKDKTVIYGALVATGRVPLRPGVVDLARQAKAAGVALAIATTTTRSNVDVLLQTCFPPDLQEAFTVIAAAEDAPIKKPAPDVYFNALARLGLSPVGVLAIEDTAQGLRAARAAGLDCLITTNDYTSDEDFSGAVAVVPDLRAAPFAAGEGGLALEQFETLASARGG